jgi:SAM-dependent methyltransferase
VQSDNITRRLRDAFRQSSDATTEKDTPKAAQRRTYQSFSDSPGASQSEKKLDAIRLPRNLEGKSVLDLGCNEGFFSAEAQRRGAARVVGIDVRPEFIEKARARSPGIDFRTQSWDELPEGKFDVALLLSSLHYERHPRLLLSRIHDILSDDGILILECGVIRAPGTETRWIQRKVGAVQYPTWDMLLHRYLESYSVRHMGRSVDQAGDPIPRHVFHCRRHRPIVLLIGGSGDSGKTELARELAAKTSTTVRVDTIIGALKQAPLTNTPLLECIHSFRDSGVTSIRKIMDELHARSLGADLADVIFRHIPLDDRLVIVEGYGLVDDVLDQLNKRLKGKCVVWRAEREDGG